MKIDLYSQRRRCSPYDSSFCQYKVCADIRGGSLERGRQMTAVVIENMDFHGFRRYVFGSFGNQAKAIIQ